MKSKVILGFAALLTIIAVVAMLSYTVCASTDMETSEVIPNPMAAGKGWFVFNARRHNFAFVVHEGRLNETDGWRYAPKGNLSFAVLDFRDNRLVHVRSVRVWRFRTEQIDGGRRVVIAGVVNVHTAIGVLENWWFRAEARDIDDADKGGDGFSISLWRPGGAENVGCWTAKLFNPRDPASLRLNRTPFYHAFGRLRGGLIEIRL